MESSQTTENPFQPIILLHPNSAVSETYMISTLNIVTIYTKIQLI